MFSEDFHSGASPRPSSFADTSWQSLASHFFIPRDRRGVAQLVSKRRSMDCRAPIRRAARIVPVFLGIVFVCILSHPTQAQVPAGTAAPARSGSPPSTDSIQQQLDVMRIEVNESRK